MENNADVFYKWKDVAKHNSEQDLWIVIGDYVYDVTAYSNEHPGGPIVLHNKAGRNATLAFQQASHSENAKNQILPKYRVGKIDHESPIEEWQTESEKSISNLVVIVGIFVFILAFIYLFSA